MDLLVLSPWFPYPPDNGSRQRAFYLLRELARQGHHLRLVTGIQDDVTLPGGSSDTLPTPLTDLCARVTAVPWCWPAGRGGGLWTALSRTPRAVLEGDNPAFRAAVQEFLSKPPDAVLAFELAAAPFVPQNIPFPTVLDDVELLGMRHASAGLRHRLMLAKSDRYWRRELRRFTRLTAVSVEEAGAIRDLVGTDGGAPPVHVLPNGVEVASFDPAARRPVPGRLLYAGSLTYGPNRDAVRWFVAYVLPRIADAIPEAHLHVTGRIPEDAAAEFASEPRVTLTGLLPDIRAALIEAEVAVAPLVTGGGGTRLKILEAWAAGVPVVSTWLGAAGLPSIREGGAPLLLVHKTPDAFAEAVIDLLRDPDDASSLAADARLYVSGQYDWRDIGRRLSELLIALTAGEPSR